MSDYDSPEESGILKVALQVAPVSHQASAAKKTVIEAAVRTVFAPFRYLLAGDIKVHIEWQISSRMRYESDSAADVDNIVKPILDAMSGPAGIMIDDCQVQELICYWSGGHEYPRAEGLEVELRFDPDAVQDKSGLVFLNVYQGLYFPLDNRLALEFLVPHAEHVISRYAAYREMIAEGISAESAYLTTPIQRLFHRSKLRGFKLITIEELRNTLR